MAPRLLAEIHALLELTTGFDPSLAADVLKDVAPLFAAVSTKDGWPSSTQAHAVSIVQRARGSREPVPRLA